VKRKLKNEKKVDFLGEEPKFKKGGIIMFNNLKLKMKKVIKNEKGMTLIELLAVLVIIAVVALIAVPAIGNIINNSKDKSILADASNILAGAKIAIQDGGCTEGTGNSAGSVTCDNTQLAKYVENVKGTSFSATKATDGTWSVKYDQIAKIKNTDLKPTLVSGTTDTVKEADLNTKLGKQSQ